ncbi:MAG: hypothetical protein P9L92_11090 [Candidatus Electryonea clarkiae]|nr:hypothetical protein [Candidatus Electryonea clarkiae]MDP8288348.1 hypothetical protein [Candidatus Electryonea clarkiae]
MKSGICKILCDVGWILESGLPAALAIKRKQNSPNHLRFGLLLSKRC